MKKIGLLTGMLLMAVMTFAQVRELSETKVESPKFVGSDATKDLNSNGKSAICNYLQNNLQQNNNFAEGVVEVLFTINSDGSVSNIIVENSVAMENDAAVTNCIKKTSGLWSPGMVNGNPVAMEKKVFVNFINPNSKSLEELAQESLELGLKKYQSAVTVKENLNLSEATANKRAERRIKTAISLMNEAHKYQPGEPSIVFWQACAYEKAGNEIKRAEKFNEFMEMVELNFQAQNNMAEIVLN